MQQIHVLHLKQNMRAENDVGFSEFVIRASSDCTKAYIMKDLIKIPNSKVIPWSGEDRTKKLIVVVFSENASILRYIIERAFLTTKSEYVGILNMKVLYAFPENECTYYSFDSVEEDMHNYINRSF